MAEDEPTNPDHCLWQLRCLRGQVYVWCCRGVKWLDLGVNFEALETAVFDYILERAGPIKMPYHLAHV